MAIDVRDIGPRGAGSSIKGKFYVENLGCFRNQVDAEYFIASMEQSGFERVEDPSAADSIIVNTCGFIETAKQESINTFFELRQAHPNAKIVLAGCLAQRYGADLKEMLPEADAIFGNKAPELLPQLYEKMEKAEGAVTWFPEELTSAPQRSNLLSHANSAFIKVAEGCIHHCTFCAIPKIRGPLASRTVDSIVLEFDQLRARGIFEFNLIAQDLASYGRDKDHPGGKLVELLEALVAKPGKFWLRLFYIHPDTFPEGLLEIMKRDRRILPYFDLPFQHADETLLKLMARYGSKEKYLELVESVRRELPDAVIRSTFLLGFPGEDKKAFQTLLDFQAEASIDWVGIFTYSREEDTAAFRRQTDEEYEASKKSAARRRSTMEARQVPITAARLDKLVGKSLEVLVEERIEGSDLWLGRIYAQAPEVDGLTVVHALPGVELRPGAVVEAQIRSRNGVDLEAYMSGVVCP